ncbi:cytochrome c [Seonamhaeicola sediminis]|uniref:Cytochrome c n=1 Tax=Seonamhaeicola sediminis TaxID=2528206 RepID=A0A562YD10_9FLAO|nr:cytochrome c [Seonamhaeicola sediminis]TWO32218.1 cytochrome c [Seonamhaeicola sediminis]
MRTTLKLMTILFTAILMNCGGKEEKKKEGFSYEKQETSTKKEVKKETSEPPSQQIDLTNKGIGPITSLTLNDAVDEKMAAHGAEVFKKLCTACHRADKKFIGPSPKGITERRTPEWIMNMILNPVEMTQKDPLAKALLMEFNGAPMANQSLSEEDARAVLEYFRTLK